MRIWIALALLLTTVIGARTALPLLRPERVAGDAVVVASLPPEPVPKISEPEPASPPVYTPEISPRSPDADSHVPGVSTAPLPGASWDLMPAGTLAVFVPTLEPAEQVAPGAAEPRPPAGVRPGTRMRPVAASARRRTGARQAYRPPVHLRWQSRVARMRNDTDWRDLAFGRL